VFARNNPLNMKRRGADITRSAPLRLVLKTISTTPLSNHTKKMKLADRDNDVLGLDG